MNASPCSYRAPAQPPRAGTPERVDLRVQRILARTALAWGLSQEPAPKRRPQATVATDERGLDRVLELFA